jgi:Flp pilus assembly protein TadB
MEASSDVEVAIYAGITGFIFLGATVFGVFWQINRSKKQDMDRLHDHIRSENSAQDESIEKKTDETHKRINSLSAELRKMDHKIGVLEGRQYGFDRVLDLLFGKN